MAIQFASIPQLAATPSRVDGVARVELAARHHPVEERATIRAVDAARAGDAEAFGALYDRYHRAVHRYALSRLGWRASDADDVTADTFIDAWRAIPRWQWTGAPFAGWLLAICNRRLLQHARAASRRPRVVVDRADHDVSVDHSDSCAAVCDRIDLAAALATLPSMQRHVLELRFFADLTTAEIAGALDRSEDAIRQIQLRALTSLRDREVAVEDCR